MLQRFVAVRIWLILDPNETGTCQPESTSWRAKSKAAIAETIEINAALDLPLGIEIDVLDALKLGSTSTESSEGCRRSIARIVSGAGRWNCMSYSERISMR